MVQTCSSKEPEGWGLENIHHVAISLVTKSGWRLISGKSLRCQVIIQKYIDHVPLVDWVRSQTKFDYGGSIIWKEIMKSLL
jgi:hypothetical protein